MESTLQRPAFVAAKIIPKAMPIVYWIVTALFCLQMSFTAYAQLRLPQVAEAFTHPASPPTSGWSSRGPSSSAWCCCLRRCRRGSRSGPTPASLSIRPAHRPHEEPRLGGHRPPLDGRWPGGVGPVGGHRRALGLSYFFWREATPASA
jgi:hypothetical protein